VEPPAGFVERLTALCAIDSMTGDQAGLDRSAALLVEWAQADGLAAEVRDTVDGPLVLLSTQGPGDGRTAALRPVERRGDLLLGPGVADMKGGLLVGLSALAALARDPSPTHGRVELWIVPDEEARSVEPSCLDDWHGATQAICLECGRADGAIVTTRMACTWLTLEADGRDAHAGTEREAGRSALMALARECLRIEEDIHGARPDMQATITQLHSGIGKNTVPGRATASVDLRAKTRSDLAWAVERVGSFAAHDGITLRRSDEPGFPPLDRAPALVERALAVLADVGAATHETIAAGASDGSWASSIGVPTIDGLGPIGGGDHGPDEWIAASSIAPRIEAVVRLCRP
jgi:glutamate carboxypeptidase